MTALMYLYTRYIIKRNKSLFHRKDGGQDETKNCLARKYFFLITAAGNSYCLLYHGTAAGAHRSRNSDAAGNAAQLASFSKSYAK